MYRNLNDTKIEALEAMGSSFGDMYYSSKIEDKIEIGLTFWFLSLVQRLIDFYCDLIFMIEFRSMFALINTYFFY